MVTPEEHRACAEDNDAFWQALDTVKWPGWGITGIFYTALHEVQAFLLEHNEDPQTHECRKEVLAKRWPDIEVPYTRLKRISGAARYKNVHSQQRLNDAQLLLVQVRGLVAAAA
jgi:hypothetical protein